MLHPVCGWPLRQLAPGAPQASKAAAAELERKLLKDKTFKKSSGEKRGQFQQVMSSIDEITEKETRKFVKQSVSLCLEV